MSSGDQCNKKFPYDDEIRCRRPHGHEGNHHAEAEIVDRSKEKWDKIKWEWDDEKVISGPPKPAILEG